MISIAKIIIAVALITAILTVSMGASTIINVEGNSIWIAYCNFYNVVKIIEDAERYNFFKCKYLINMPEKFTLEFTNRSVILLCDGKRIAIKEFHYNLVIVGPNKIKHGIVTIISKIDNIVILVNL